MQLCCWSDAQGFLYTAVNWLHLGICEHTVMWNKTSGLRSARGGGLGPILLEPRSDENTTKTASGTNRLVCALPGNRRQKITRLYGKDDKKNCLNRKLCPASVLLSPCRSGLQCFLSFCLLWFHELHFFFCSVSNISSQLSLLLLPLSPPWQWRCSAISEALRACTDAKNALVCLSAQPLCRLHQNQCDGHAGRRRTHPPRTL